MTLLLKRFINWHNVEKIPKNVSNKFWKTKNSSKFVYILAKQCRSPFNLTNFFTRIFAHDFCEFEIDFICVFDFRNAMLNPLLKPSKNTSPKWAKLSVLTKMASRRCALGTLCPATSSKFPVRKFSTSLVLHDVNGHPLESDADVIV